MENEVYKEFGIKLGKYLCPNDHFKNKNVKFTIQYGLTLK